MSIHGITTTCGADVDDQNDEEGVPGSKQKPCSPEDSGVLIIFTIIDTFFRDEQVLQISFMPTVHISPPI